MNDYLPRVDLKFILDNILKCDKINPDSLILISNYMTMLALSGNKPIHKRHIFITHEDNEVDFEQASGLASRFQFMGSLLAWLEEHKLWKEGGYIVPKKVTEDIESEEE